MTRGRAALRLVCVHTSVSKRLLDRDFTDEGLQLSRGRQSRCMAVADEAQLRAIG